MLPVILEKYQLAWTMEVWRKINRGWTNVVMTSWQIFKNYHFKIHETYSRIFVQFTGQKKIIIG